MSARLALALLGLDWLDVHLMTRDLLDAIAERNRELIASFNAQ